MSYALLRSGIDLEKAPNGGSLIGQDGKNYWFRVRDLTAYLKSRFQAGDVEYSLPPAPDIIERSKLQDFYTQRKEAATSNILEKIKDKQGIIVFDVSGWDNATGHFTLWDGSNLVYPGAEAHNDPNSPEYYFWLIRGQNESTTTVKISVQTVKVTFWELL